MEPGRDSLALKTLGQGGWRGKDAAGLGGSGAYTTPMCTPTCTPMHTPPPVLPPASSCHRQPPAPLPPLCPRAAEPWSFPGATGVPWEQIWGEKPRCHLLCEDTRATQQPACLQPCAGGDRRGRPASCPPGCSDLGAVGRETSWAPKPGNSQGVRQGKPLPNHLLSPNTSFPRDFPQQPAAPLLLTVSPCPGDAGSLWMLPWKGPQEKPSGRLLRVRTRLSPSCTARSSSSMGRQAQHQHDAPPRPKNPSQTPGPRQPQGCRGTTWSRELLGGCPRGCMPMVGGWDPAARRGVRARHGGSGHGPAAERKEHFPSPHPKSQQLQGLMALII